MGGTGGGGGVGWGEGGDGVWRSLFCGGGVSVGGSG